MKALTIKQPFANLIVSGFKDVENRTWPTKRRERIYIHASQSKEYISNIPKAVNKKQFDSLPGNEQYQLTHGIWVWSAIIGEVEIIDCVRNSDSVWALPDNWHWILANPVKYRNPILNVKGKLSFWEYTL